MKEEVGGGRWEEDTENASSVVIYLLNGQVSLE